MPMYEFECGKCDHILEKLMGLKESHPRKCPVCGSLSLKKVIFGSRPVQLHMRYSFMAPRHMRGQRRRKGKGSGN